MTDEEKKKFVKNTIIQGNGKRITEVLLRYFASAKKNGITIHTENNKVATFEKAKELFT